MSRSKFELATFQRTLSRYCWALVTPNALFHRFDRDIHTPPREPGMPPDNGRAQEALAGERAAQAARQPPGGEQQGADESPGGPSGEWQPQPERHRAAAPPTPPASAGAAHALAPPFFQTRRPACRRPACRRPACSRRPARRPAPTWQMCRTRSRSQPAPSSCVCGRIRRPPLLSRILQRGLPPACCCCCWPPTPCSARHAASTAQLW